MNKYILNLIGLALVGSSAAAFAQEAANEVSTSAASLRQELRENVEIAPTLGVTSFFLEQSGKDADAKAGVMVGVLAQGKIVQNIRGQAGLMYFQAGGENKNFDLNFTYLGFTVNGLYYLTNSAKTGMYLKAGMMPSYMLDAEAEVGSRDISIGTSVNRWDVIPSVGAGYEVHAAGFNTMLFELNYHHGLMDGRRGKAEAYNRGLMLTGTIAL